MSETQSAEKLAALEALLFLHGEPLSYKKLEALLELENGHGKELAAELARSLESESRGLTLVMDDEHVQLVTKSKFHAILEAFIKEQLTEDLTPASLETLAIIAYFGPISRARIDYQRGVNSSFILRSLLLRGLVERSPDPEHANSFLYRASFDFWRHIGVQKPEDLPDFEKFKGLLNQFETQV